MKELYLKFDYESDEIDGCISCHVPRKGDLVYIRKTLYVIEVVCWSINDCAIEREVQITLKLDEEYT